MLFLLPFLLPLLLILTPIPTAAAAPAPAPAGGGNPPTPPPPATPPTWLFDLGPSKPVLDVQEFSPEQIADMTAEYQRLRRNMHQELLAQHPPPNRPPPSALRTAATHLEQRLAALIQQHRRANLARADETMRTTLDAHLSYMEKCLGAAQRNLDEGGRPDVCRVWLRSLAESVAEVTRARKVQAKAELRLGDDEQQQQRPHANGHGDGELSSSSSPAVDMRLDMLVTRVVRAVRRVVPSAVDNDDVRLWSDAIRARMKALLVAAARAGHPPAARGAGWGVPGAGAGAGAVLLQAAARAG